MFWLFCQSEVLIAIRCSVLPLSHYRNCITTVNISENEFLRLFKEGYNIYGIKVVSDTSVSKMSVLWEVKREVLLLDVCPLMCF